MTQNIAGYASIFGALRTLGVSRDTGQDRLSGEPVEAVVLTLRRTRNVIFGTITQPVATDILSVLRNLRGIADASPWNWVEIVIQAFAFVVVGITPFLYGEPILENTLALARSQCVRLG